VRVFNLLLLALLLAGTAAAQALSNQVPTDTPTVTVTKYSWRQEIFIPALYDDPMQINQDRDELERDQKATSKANADRVRQGQAPLPLPTKKIASNTPVGSTPMGTPLGDEPVGNKNLPAKEEPGLSSVHYIYELKINNTGVKTIRLIVWEYSLFDPDTHLELGRHRFSNSVNIRAGKTANLVGRSKTPPARIVQATKPDKDDKELRGKYAERVTIQRIEYDDGTIWERPLN